MRLTPTIWLALVGLILVSLCLWACAQDEDDDHDGDPEIDDDDDSAGDDDDDNDDDSTPNDRLYAGASVAVLTPNAQNHPETIYLGGIFPSRKATGVHDDLLASVLMLAQGDEQVVMVSLDFLGFILSRIREIQQRLADFGFKKEHVLIASTHTHEAPDTLGVFGPNVLQSGVSRTYMKFVQNAIFEAVMEAREQLEPVTMRAATAPVDFPVSNRPTLMHDSRIPDITVPWLSAASFEDEQGATVATLVNWHSHPEVMIQSTQVSADFPQWVRYRMQDLLGGTSVYISGAVGGLASPYEVDVPARGENGDPILDGTGNPVYLREGTWDKTRSLGYVIADLAIEALEAANTLTDPTLSVTVKPLALPVENLVMMLAYLIGLVEFDEEDRITDRPDFCGFFGCSNDRIGLVRLGPITLVTAPGETFPETLIGRTASDYDFGAPWGIFDFPAIAGILPTMNAEVPMHMGLCGNEIGYLIPEKDFHGKDHPDYYEEDLFWGYRTETIYREAAIDLLGR